MKKYLMTGIAALALCAGFTSCSHDLDAPSQEELDNLEAQKTIATYKAAFENYIGGKVASNQTWGFSGTFSTTRTRADFPNANQWGKDLKYNVPIELTAGQKERVKRYFQYNQLEPGGSKDWTEFFIQQVYKGGTDPLTGEGYSPEKYMAMNGTDFFGSNNMDYLTANGDKWDHIYNFNYGRYSSPDTDPNGKPNDMVQNTPGVTYYSTGGQEGYHSDQIQLMTGSLATGFGYGNSQATKSYNDKYRMVSGAVIDEWATQYGGGVGEAVTGRDFVGFDFEQLYKDEDAYVMVWNGSENVYKTFVFEGNEYRYANNKPNAYCGDHQTVEYPNGATEQSADNIRYWLGQGYRPYDNGTMKDWVKIKKCADGYFSDWIICIGEATKWSDPANLRVMAEDLTNGTADEDFDFNDVVFDVFFGNANDVKVVIKAAGGTLPLRISRVEYPDYNIDGNWSEVHELFNDANNRNDLAGKMLNTHGTDADQAPGVRSRSVDGLKCPEFTLPYAIWTNADAKKIIIQVQKGGIWTEITSEQGEPAAKFAVPGTYGWMKERTSIKAINQTFVNWCTDNDDLIWVGGINE